MIQPRIKLALLFTLLSVALISCGKSTPKKLGPGGLGKKKDDRARSEEKEAECRSHTYSDYHEITVESFSALPKKIAVVMENSKKIDECKGVPIVLPPLAEVSRSNQFNALVILVQHLSYYPTPPKKISLDIYDLGDCSSGTESPYLSLRELSLEYKTEYPYSTDCPGIQAAHAKLRK